MSSSTCPVCNKQVEDARLLPCLHLVCNRCVQKTVAAAQLEIVAPACPACHRLFSPDKLPVPDDYKQNASKPQLSTQGNVQQTVLQPASGNFVFNPPTLPNTSTSTNAPPTFTFSKGTTTTAPPVYQAPVPESTAPSQSVSLSKSPSGDKLHSDAPVCSQIHQGAKHVGFCDDCEFVVCQECVDNYHKKHSVASLVEAASDLANLRESLKARLDSVRDAEKDLETYLKTATSKLEQIQGAVADSSNPPFVAAPAPAPAPAHEPAPEPLLHAVAVPPDDDEEEEMLDVELAPRFHMLQLTDPSLTMMVRKSRLIASIASYGLARRHYLSKDMETPYRILGRTGSGPTELSNPVGLAVTPDGLLIIGDSKNKRLLIWTAEGEFVREIPTGSRPNHVAFSPLTGLIWVALNARGSLQAYKLDGTPQQQISFNGAIGVAVGPDGNIYAADGGITVAAFTPTGERLWLSTQIVITARANAICVTRDGEVLICVHDISRILVLSAKDGRFYRFVGVGKMNHPQGVAIGHDGHIFVSETSSNQLSIWTLDGVLVTKIGRAGAQPGQFNLPQGIAVLPDSHIAVADYYNDRIQIF